MKLDKTSLTSRMLASTPIALVITIGLGLTMAKFISSDFELNNNNGKKLNFEISTKIDDPDLPTDMVEFDEVRVVDIPPPPPSMPKGNMDTPTVPAPIDPKTPDFPDEIIIDTERSVITVSDTHAQPIVRIPPAMPARAEKSGHCDMRFDVSADGAPFNIQATSCSASLFKRSSVKNVGKWKYRPKIADNQAVAMRGVQTTISYHLTDARGNTIPE